MTSFDFLAILTFILFFLSLQFTMSYIVCTLNFFFKDDLCLINSSATKYGFWQGGRGCEPTSVKAQSALGVIGNIAFPSSRNKGKNISPPFTQDEFTQIPPLAQWLPTFDLLILLLTSWIELIFGEVLDKYAIFIWV